MRKLLLSTALVLAAGAAQAQEWSTGLYGGIAATQEITTTTTSEEVQVHPECMEECEIEIVETTTSSTDFTEDAFVGFRLFPGDNALGFGVEGSLTGDIEGQAGLRAGRLFAYGAFDSKERINIGADFLITNSLFAGVKAIGIDGDDVLGSVRVGLKF